MTLFYARHGSYQGFPYYGYVPCTYCDPSQKGYQWTSSVWQLQGTDDRDNRYLSVSTLPSPANITEGTVYDSSTGKPYGTPAPTPIAAPSPSVPSLITVQIGVIGSGKVLSSGGDNSLADRGSISVPSGYKAYFQAVPGSGYNFTKFVSADGMSSSQNPIELPVTVNGSITAYFVAASPATAPVKPPAEGTPEIFAEKYLNYTINVQGSYYHVYRPDGMGIGLFSTITTARQGVDADIISRNPLVPPEPPATTTTPSTGTEAIKYTCPNGGDIFVDPNMLRTGINPYDLCGATTLPAPGQPLTPEQQRAQDAIDAAAAVAKANAGQSITPQQQEAINKYFTTEQPEKPKDNTGLYIIGAAAILGFALLFRGK